MKSIQIHRYGGPEVLQRLDVPVPVAAPGMLLVRVHHAGINFMDIHTRQGKYAKSQSYPVRLPCTLGMEGAGVVEAVGEGVSSHVVGDRVAWCVVWGSYAEYAVVPAWQAAKVPAAVPLDLAAVSVFQSFTAHYLVHDVGQLGPGKTCLIHAASGRIGQIMIQLAKRTGARVLATTSSSDKIAAARSLGADDAFLYDNGGFADAARKATGGQGVDVVFDAIGKTTLRDSFRATRTRGLVVNYGSTAGAMTDLDPLELGESGSLYLTRPRLADHLRNAEEINRRADDVFTALQDGSLVIDIAGRYTLDNVEVAHEAYEQRQMAGKAVLDVISR
jgi:NADPH2:quinone reductase